MEGSQEDEEERENVGDTKEYYDIDEDNFDDEEYGLGGGLGGSEPKPLGGIYQLFDSIRTAPRSTKVSNLNKTELGDLGISVRESMRIALLANSFGHKKFANFFLNQAGIVSDSAMSKEGWFTELIVTSKKFASRSSSSEIKALPESKQKWKMFSGKRTGNQNQE